MPTVICPCGNSFKTSPARIKTGRGIYCSKACMYKYCKRPSGLKYQKHKDNPTSFKKGHKTWNKGLGGTGLVPPTPGSIKKGERRGIQTEFTSENSKAEKNVNWKGDEVSYWGLHTWILRTLGPATHCEICGSKDKSRYVWHNVSTRYKRDIVGWMQLCTSCHISIHYGIKRLKNKIAERCVSQ